MNTKKILIIHDGDDAETVKEMTIGFSNLMQLYNLELEPYVLDVDISGLKKGVVKKKELAKVTKLVKSASVVIILISSTTLASTELDTFFKKNSTLFSSKYSFFIISRYCSWQYADWIGTSAIFPLSKKPLSTYSKSKREQIFQEIEIEIRKFFDHGIKSQMNDEYRIFISYSHKDGYFVDLLKYKLMEEGIAVSIDIDYLLAGKNWKTGIDYEIDRCDIMLVIVSSNSKASEYVAYEWAFAMGKGKNIIPIVIEEGLELHPKLQELENFRGLIDRKNQNWEKLHDIITNYKISVESSKLLEKPPLPQKL